jgi:RNA polymerase sigma factor (sigma-70 family)
MADAYGEAVCRHLRNVLEAGAVGSLTDGVLLERFVAGRGDAKSSAAFAALVERHGAMVRRVCRGVLRDGHEADDAAQATFLVLAHRAIAIRRADSLASWLFGVALRVAARARIAEARRRRRERRGGEMRAQEANGQSREESWAGLHEEIGRLAERHRGPVVLCGLEGLTHDQAAARLGVPVRTVQRRLVEAKDRLRIRLVSRGLAPVVGLLGAGAVVESAQAAWAEATVRSALSIAAGGTTASAASVTVAALTEGVVTTMALGRWKVIAAGLLTCGVVSAAWVAVARVPAPTGRPAQVVAEKADAAAIRGASLGPRVEGIVVDEQGRPIAGASVAVLWAVVPRPTTTAADGTFALKTDDPRRANLAFIATADAGARQGIFRYQDLSGGKDPRMPVRIVLRPAREVKVTAVDGKEAPVPGAEVFLLDLVFPVARGRTDARGVVTLRAPTEAMTQFLFGLKPGVGFDYFETSRSVPPMFTPPPPEVRLVLDGVRTVRVKAVDSAGRPVPEVELVPWLLRKKGKLNDVNLSGFEIKARTDAAGIATFDWLPADMQGQAMFLLASPEYFLPDRVEYEADRPVAEVVARVLRNVRISGRVVKPDGAPAPDILVEATGGGSRNPASRGFGRTRTEADGTYTMSLAPEESYMIAILDDAWAAPTRSGVIVSEGHDLGGIDFTLGKGAIVRGRVTTGLTSAPAVGETVILDEQGSIVAAGAIADRNDRFVESLMRVVETEGDGRYAFRVGPGGYGLRGPSEPLGPRRSEEQFSVAEGQVIEKDFHLRRQVRLGRALRGAVRARTSDGPVIAGAVVVEEPIGARVPPVRGVADDRGRFELPRHVERALVYARSPNGDLAGYVMADEDRDEVTIVAAPATSARGRIVDASGKSRAGVTVHYAILISPGGDNPPVAAGDSTVTDADGRFTAVGLLPGTRCRLFASNLEGGNSKDRTFDVDGPAPTDLGAITLDPTGRTDGPPSKGSP